MALCQSAENQPPSQFPVSFLLMTYEPVSFTQADLRTVRRSTTERKIMSTKTSIKRIALVAVAALGLGTFANVPANAAQAAGNINSISLAQVTTTPTVGAATAVNFEANTDTITNADDTTPADVVYNFVGYLSSYPSGAFAQVGVSTTAPTTDTEIFTAGTGTGSAVTESQSGSTYTVTLNGDDADEDYVANTTDATAAIGAAQFSFTPTVAGSYVMTVWNDADKDGGIDIGEAVQTISLTVVAAAGFSAGLTTSILDVADSHDNTADETGLAISKTAGTNAASIEVNIKDTTNTALGGMRVTAEVTSGPGLVDVVTGETAYADATARADSLTLAAGVTEATVHVTADGTAGASVITVKVTDPVTLAVLGTYTETLWFYGTVSTLEVVLQNLFVARASAAGAELGEDAAGATWATVATTPAVYLVAKDSSGNVVPGLTVTGVTSDTSVIGASSCNGDDATAGDGPGYYNCSVTSAAGGTSGKTATVTFRTQLSTGAYVSATPVTFALGGSLATGTLSLDKTSYAAGEAMIVTRTAKDSSGNAVYDGVASPAVVFNKAIGGTAPAAGEFINGKSSSSSTRPTVFAPSVNGDFEARATYTNATTGASTQITAAAAVVIEGATDAADAANEATDAANAATDAANAAAEAADAATAAAQDAQAAVAELATKVASLMAGIKAQITSLTNLVIKIQKKVKA